SKWGLYGNSRSYQYKRRKRPSNSSAAGSVREIKTSTARAISRHTKPGAPPRLATGKVASVSKRAPLNLLKFGISNFIGASSAERYRRKADCQGRLKLSWTFSEDARDAGASSSDPCPMS